MFMYDCVAKKKESGSNLAFVIDNNRMIILVEAALFICSIFKFISTRLNFPINLQNCGPICDSLFPGFFHYPICPFHFSGSATSIFCYRYRYANVVCIWGSVDFAFLALPCPLGKCQQFLFHSQGAIHTHTHARKCT